MGKTLNFETPAKSILVSHRIRRRIIENVFQKKFKLVNRFQKKMLVYFYKKQKLESPHLKNSPQKNRRILCE